MALDLCGQVAVVTGGSRGIGRAVTLALAAAGGTVIVGYRSDEDAAKATCEQAAFGRGKAMLAKVDVTAPDQVRDFFDRLEQMAGPPDVLVNCAGIWPAAKAWEMSDEHWRRTMAVNLDGTYYSCKQACLRMIPRRRGTIVNLSSVSATRGARTGHADYSAAKGGVESLTKSLASELGPYGITVNAVAPGMIRTDMTSQALAAREQEYLAQIPLGKIGTPEDVAAAVLFLVSPGARYITGQVLHVNGGLLMP